MVKETSYLLFKKLASGIWGDWFWHCKALKGLQSRCMCRTQQHCWRSKLNSCTLVPTDFQLYRKKETQSLFSFLVFLCSKVTKLDFNPCTLVPTDFQSYRKMKLKFYFRFSSQQKNQIGVLFSFFIFPRRKGNGIRIHLMLSVFLFL